MLRPLTAKGDVEYLMKLFGVKLPWVVKMKLHVISNQRVKKNCFDLHLHLTQTHMTLCTGGGRGPHPCTAGWCPLCILLYLSSVLTKGSYSHLSGELCLSLWCVTFLWMRERERVGCWFASVQQRSSHRCRIVFLIHKCVASVPNIHIHTPTPWYTISL